MNNSYDPNQTPDTPEINTPYESAEPIAPPVYDPEFKPIKSNKSMIIILITVAITALAVIFALVTYLTNGFGSAGKAETQAVQSVPVLTITSCPEQVTSVDPTVVISGSMSDSASTCVLTINGETIDVTPSAGASKSWSKSYVLTEGETRTFEIVLTNEQGVSAKETKTVYCQALQNTPKAAPQPVVTGPLQAGCEFIKKNANGLNIRSYAGTDYDIVAYIARGDYTSRMVFTGSYRVSYDGYTWYQVIAPNGKYGYVRSDLVKRIS